MNFLKKEYSDLGKKYPEYVLSGDIGGTNCKLGIFGVKGKNVFLLVRFQFGSKELKNLHQPVNIVLGFAKNKGIRIKKCCLGIAGALSVKRDYVHLTNASLHVDVKELGKKTGLRKIILLNDFEAIGYAINLLNRNFLKKIKSGTKVSKSPKVILGAGTGLGKSTLIYDLRINSYVPLPSEAHHADFPAQSRQEIQLVEYIKRRRKIQKVSNGDVLSGDGIDNIYQFLRKSGKFKKTVFTKEIESAPDTPSAISKYRKSDQACKETFNLFRKAYAAFAKGCALDSLAFGGVYIAGGIAPKNKGIFDKKFIKEFMKSEKMKKVLRKIPVYLVLNEDAGLLGAAFAGSRVLNRRLKSS